MTFSLRVIEHKNAEYARFTFLYLETSGHMALFWLWLLINQFLQWPFELTIWYMTLFIFWSAILFFCFMLMFFLWVSFFKFVFRPFNIHILMLFERYQCCFSYCSLCAVPVGKFAIQYSMWILNIWKCLTYVPWTEKLSSAISKCQLIILGNAGEVFKSKIVRYNGDILYPWFKNLIDLQFKNDLDLCFPHNDNLCNLSQCKFKFVSANTVDFWILSLYIQNNFI